MEFVYPAVFHSNDDGSYTVIFPDLPGCITEGKSLSNAIFMAEDAMTQWLSYTVDNNQEIPKSSGMGSVICADGEFVNLIRAEVKDKRATKRTVSLPKWMDEQAIDAGLSLSRVLQDALSSRLSR